MLFFIKNNRLLHILTNSFLLLNINLLTGRNNHIRGRLRGFLSKTKTRIKGCDNQIIYEDGCRVSSSRIYISGNENIVLIKKGCVIEECLIWINGNNSKIILGEKNYHVRTEFGVEHDNGLIELSENILIGGFMKLGTKKNHTEITRIYVAEGHQIILKKSCVISDGVNIRTSDSHSIFDENNKRINHAKDIMIGEHAWVCSGSSMLKGSAIGDNAILGYKSVLTKDYSSLKNVILTGIPAKPVRENIVWDLHLVPVDGDFNDE